MDFYENVPKLCTGGIDFLASISAQGEKMADECTDQKRQCIRQDYLEHKFEDFLLVTIVYLFGGLVIFPLLYRPWEKLYWG